MQVSFERRASKDQAHALTVRGPDCGMSGQRHRYILGSCLHGAAIQEGGVVE